MFSTYALLVKLGSFIMTGGWQGKSKQNTHDLNIGVSDLMMAFRLRLPLSIKTIFVLWIFSLTAAVCLSTMLTTLLLHWYS